MNFSCIAYNYSNLLFNQNFSYSLDTNVFRIESSNNMITSHTEYRNLKYFLHKMVILCEYYGEKKKYKYRSNQIQKFNSWKLERK